MNPSPSRPTSTSGRVEHDSPTPRHAGCKVTRFSKRTNKSFSTRSRLELAKQLDENLTSSETQGETDKDVVLDKDEYEMLQVISTLVTPSLTSLSFNQAFNSIFSVPALKLGIVRAVCQDDIEIEDDISDEKYTLKQTPESTFPRDAREEEEVEEA